MLFTYIYSVLKKILFLVFLNGYFKHSYPEEYSKITYNLSYNAIYVYSKFQIILNRLFKRVNKFIDSSPYLKNKISLFYNFKLINQHCKQDVEYMNNGELIKTNKDEFIRAFKDKPGIFKDCRFIIYSDYEKCVDNCINKKIIRSNNEDYHFDESNIRFILVELICDKSSYKIILKDEKYNYYMVDNIIDKSFIMYYILKHYNENKIFEEINFSKKLILKIIDQNVNIIELDLRNDNDSILIQKENYLRLVTKEPTIIHY